MRQEERWAGLEDIVWDWINQQMYEALEKTEDYGGYADEMGRLLESNRYITCIWRGTLKGPIILSQQDLNALTRVMHLDDKMKEVERKELYFRGYTHCVQLAVRLGLI